MVSFSGSQCLPLNAKGTLQIFMIERTMYAIHLALQLQKINFKCSDRVKIKYVHFLPQPA